jgi:hypothetical protein
MEKKNFVNNQRIMFHSTADPELNGLTGVIKGRSFVDVFDFYIVLLDNRYPKSPDWDAISITEHCLESV